MASGQTHADPCITSALFRGVHSKASDKGTKVINHIKFEIIILSSEFISTPHSLYIIDTCFTLQSQRLLYTSIPCMQLKLQNASHTIMILH